MKILVTGDVHIGRRSSRLPLHLSGHAHSCSSAWTRVVDHAMAERVDLVIVTGDLVDQENRYLEAVGPLETGLRRLAGAGVRTVVVAGNHDHDVLPALVDAVGSSSVRLLGRGGRWERLTVEAGDDRVHLDGWSFPRAHQDENPLKGYEPILDGSPVLALLHADLEQPGSRYAPVSLSDLRRFPYVFFLLGHVHAPRLVEEPAGARYLYPGSPQAMDPAEVGWHGVYELEVRGEEITSRRVPLSTVWYDSVDVSLDGIERAEEADARLHTTVREDLARLAGASERLRVVRYRVRLTGSCRPAREVERRLNDYAREFELADGAVLASIDSIGSELRPPHDLTALANGMGAPAVLARLLLREPGVDEVLRRELKRVVREIHESRSFIEVRGGDEDLATLEDLALAEADRAARLLLDGLLEQKGVPEWAG